MKNKFEEFFTEEEKKHWERIFKKLGENPAFERITSYVRETEKEIGEDDYKAFLSQLEPLLGKFVPIPLGSRILNPNLVNDLIARYITEIADMSLDDFYATGNRVQDTIKTGKTYLALPQDLFEETDFENLLKIIGATVLHLPKVLNRSLGLLGAHASAILRGAGENKKFAQILFRHGILDINEDESFTIHFDRFIVALGDPSFVEEVSDFAVQYIPMEIFYGPQSIMGIALSRSIANGLLAAAIAAKNTNQQEKFVNQVKEIGRRIKTIHEELNSLQPNWDAIIENLNEVFSIINAYTKGIKKEFPPLYRIMSFAGEIGVYPDIVIEAAGLVTKEFTASEWAWLEKTQEVALKTASQAKPLYRQPIYWLALTCIRSVTAPDSIVSKIRDITSRFAVGKIF